MMTPVGIVKDFNCFVYSGSTALCTDPLMLSKVLTPNDFANAEDVAERLRLYEALSNQQPRPFAWKFTRDKPAPCLKRLEAHSVMAEPGQAVPEFCDMDQEEPLAA
jgi:hypothetical protein